MPTKITKKQSIIEQALNPDEIATWRNLNAKITKFKRDKNRIRPYKPRPKHNQ